MRAATLLRRSLIYYWRTNVAVIIGVAIAVAVLAGALMVGASVRESLRSLVVARLGATDVVVTSTGFFREELDAELRSNERWRTHFEESAPILMLEGLVADQVDGRRASHVQVYGIDERFWKFHRLESVAAPQGSDALLSEALAREIGAVPSQSVLLRVETASAIPTESLYGRKEDVGRTVRFTVRQVLRVNELGEFSLSPKQGSVRAIFVPLRRIQTALSQAGHVNVLLLGERDVSDSANREMARAELERLVHDVARLEDVGLKLRPTARETEFVLESPSTMLDDRIASSARATAERAGLDTLPVFAYLANSIRTTTRDIPYSVIAAMDLARAGLTSTNSPTDIVLNSWAARELNARVGDPVSIDYYAWETEGRLSTHAANFHVAAIVPIEGLAADRSLVPDYPGITDSDRLADWDPPFPIDLRRVRPVDEEYWKTYRATPKAFIPLEAGQQLWRSRYGALTSLRFRNRDGAAPVAMTQFGAALRSEIDPLSLGFAVSDVRAQSIAASEGATDFGEYFTYFSMFLVVSALLLAALFFKFGVEQRVSEIGLLQALGLNAAAIRRLFVGEGLVLSAAGAIAGIGGAVAYAAFVMYGLRTWWFDAVGTTSLRLHVHPTSLIAGAAGGMLISIISIWWSLRSLARSSSRALLVEKRGRVPFRAPLVGGVAFSVLALALFGATFAGAVGRVGGFFGAAACSLVAVLSWTYAWLRATHHRRVHGHGALAIWRLGIRNATWRPERSVLCIALIAFAVFLIAALETFKRDDRASLLDRHSGTGGYPLLAESLLPIVHDLNSPQGRDAMNLAQGAELESVRFDRFRVRPGDDTSCLNLYQPKNPKILGASPAFVNANRFSFQSSLATTPEESANPWLLLNRQFENGAVPVITDANSMTYVLHMKLGDELTLPGRVDRPIKLKIVAALSDSVLQGELVMAEQPFVRLFPESEGYRFFLIDAPPERIQTVTKTLETTLTDFGVDVASTGDRLAAFHRVEYTYLSTFQMLGGLGVILGTFGLAAVLLRNVLERRRELAVLKAVGYQHADFFTMVVAENVFLLVTGLGAGVFCALLATAPALIERGNRFPILTLGWLLSGVLAAGLIASIGATIAALRSPLLAALRSE